VREKRAGIGAIIRRSWRRLKRLFRRNGTENQEILSARFLDLALQYHVAGRSAYFAYSMPVAGNILHHAIEMLLKSLLLEKGYTATQLKDNFRHNLRRLWKETKKVAGNPGLTAYDQVIVRIAAMEELRYPRRGYTFQMSLRKEPPSPATGPAAAGLRHYHVSLEEVDELMKILLTNNVTPDWVRTRLSRGDAINQYLRENLHSFI